MKHNILLKKYSPNFWGSFFSAKHSQAKYLQVYLEALRVKAVIVEPNYFDSDFSAEFSAFYGQVAKQIEHTCKRFLFFSCPVDSRIFNKAISGNTEAIEKLQAHFLGFVVYRPLEHAPFGKTVLRWFDDLTIDKLPRIVQPSRNYKLHLVNIELSIDGVAWQQQDQGVSACATIALWSMLHSSANQEDCFVPTTRDITENANYGGSNGARVFPSSGLTIYQLCEAIKWNMMSPILVEGEIECEKTGITGFEKEVFNNYIGTFVKSGYPILISGFCVDKISNGKLVLSEGHAVCCVGYRSASGSLVVAGKTGYEEKNINVLYIHDDNFGPNVRFEIAEAVIDKKKLVILKTKGPNLLDYGYELQGEDPFKGVYQFIPTGMIIAINRDINLSPQDLIIQGQRLMNGLATYFKQVLEDIKRWDSKNSGLNISFRFINATEYLDREIKKLFPSGASDVARNIRLSLKEKCYLSKHVGIIRVGFFGYVLLDVVVDTSNIDKDSNVIASIAYDKEFMDILKGYQKKRPLINWGLFINGF